MKQNTELKIYGGLIIDLPHLTECVRHFLTLLLCPLVSAQLSFSNFQSPLILSNFEKLSDPLLIWCKSSNFPDQAPHKEDSFTGFLHVVKTMKRDQINRL